jgi:hypothetical protein
MDKKHTALARVIERELLNRSTDLARESVRLDLLARKMRAARGRNRRPSRDVLAFVLHADVARSALARFLDRDDDASFRELLDAIEGRPPKRAGSPTDPVAQAAAIVRDATEVDWSRDAETEYESAIRRAFIADRLACNVPFGLMQLVSMAIDRRPCAADLAAAAAEAEALLRKRMEERERRELRDARDAVDRNEGDCDDLGGV